MPDDRPEIEIDYGEEMNLLASQVQAKSTPGSPLARIDRHELSTILGQLIRPLAQELEHVRQGTDKHNLMLTALGKAINAQHAVPASLETIAQQLQRLGSVETANQKLFDALHTELKGYKDNFLFDALQKPFIRDLISLFDDLSEVHAQMTRRLEAAVGRGGADADGDVAFLRTLAGNVENQIAHMIEVFLRMDVVLSRTCVGAPLDKKNHRTTGFEPAASPEDDGTVARSGKPGFFWHDRTIRPEDVVVRRWTVSGTSAPVPAAPPPQTKLVPDPGTHPAADTP